MNELADHMEVNEVARRTGMASRFWKDHAKNGNVKGYRLGNRIVLDLDSVNAFLEANKLKRLGQPEHLLKWHRSPKNRATRSGYATGSRVGVG